MPGMTWEEIAPAYRDSLVRFAESYAQRASEAEDVVQDVFVRLLRPGGARVPERPGAYLRRAVANECVSHWRRHKRERLTDEMPELSQGDSAEAIADRIVLRSAIALLPLRMKQVIALGFLEGRTDADIASTLGITSITVRTTRARALRHLRELLTEEQQPVARLAGARQGEPALTGPQNSAVAGSTPESAVPGPDATPPITLAGVSRDDADEAVPRELLAA